MTTSHCVRRGFERNSDFHFCGWEKSKIKNFHLLRDPDAICHSEFIFEPTQNRSDADAVRSKIGLFSGPIGTKLDSFVGEKGNKFIQENPLFVFFISDDGKKSFRAKVSNSLRICRYDVNGWRKWVTQMSDANGWRNGRRKCLKPKWDVKCAMPIWDIDLRCQMWDVYMRRQWVVPILWQMSDVNVWHQFSAPNVWCHYETSVCDAECVMQMFDVHMWGQNGILMCDVRVWRHMCDMSCWAAMLNVWYQWKAQEVDANSLRKWLTLTCAAKILRTNICR